MFLITISNSSKLNWEDLREMLKQKKVVLFYKFGYNNYSLVSRPTKIKGYNLTQKSTQKVGSHKRKKALGYSIEVRVST
jgi:hypothetical protein